MALAATGGLVLDPWQAEVLDVALGERADGRWAAREVGLVVPRQNGKGSILEALILAALLLFDEKLILYSAHEFKTAQETFLRVKSLILANDDLASRVDKIHNAHGSEGIELTTGQRLRFVARSKGSGRGFSPQRIILDEALNLSDRAVAALLFSLSAQDNPQVWYTSSHPESTDEGQVLRQLMRRGRAGDESLAYMEFCAPDDASPDDVSAWAAANPGFPHRISPETIRTERGAVDPTHFLRERLGVIDLDALTDRVIASAKWAACADPLSGPVDSVTFSLDVSPDRSTYTFAVAGVSGRGGVHIEVVSHGPHPGPDWIVAEALRLQGEHGGQLTVVAGSPAASLLEALEAAGVRLHVIPAAEYVQSCGDFYDAVIQTDVLHLNQPELNAAVAGADRRWSGDAWYWARRTSVEDITPLVAVTTARWAHLHAPVKPALSVW